MHQGGCTLACRCSQRPVANEAIFRDEVSLDEIGRLSSNDRSELFRESATRLGIGSPVLLEKDYWVCWSLGELFKPGLLDGLVFKGGTSLSKAYDLIRRFSEDVDLTVPLSALGIEPPAEPQARRARERAFEAAKARCAEVLSCWVGQELQASAAASGMQGTLKVTVDASDPLTLVLEYPPSLVDREYGASSYIRPSVRLEFGVRGGVEPAEMLEIEPYCTKAMPNAFGRQTVGVRVLAAERTLWEKATICHANYHRSPSGPIDRVSRHYSDLAVMASHEVAEKALRQPGLLSVVVANTEANFPAAWARYEEATPAGLRIVPHPDLAAFLRRDYADMSVMFFDRPPPFDEVIRKLGVFEGRIRAIQSSA